MTKEQELVELLNTLPLSEKLRFKLLANTELRKEEPMPANPRLNNGRRFRTTTVGGTIIREWL